MIQIILIAISMIYFSGLFIAVGFIGIWNEAEIRKIDYYKVYLSWYTVFNLVKLSNK